LSAGNPENPTFSFFPDGVRLQRPISPLLLRILAVNVMALAILVGGLLYLGNYQDRIVATQLNEMQAQARIVASAVAENAIVVDRTNQNILSPLLTRMMVRHLAEATKNRTRVFSASETLLADSHLLVGKSGKAEAEEPPGEEDIAVSWFSRAIAAVFDVIDIIHERRVYPPYSDQASLPPNRFEIVNRALAGDSATQVWSMSRGGLILAVAVPVQHLDTVLGAVMMSRSDASIDRAITAVRINILQVFFMTLGVTILLSLYLANAIARPLRQLSLAAEMLRRGQTNRTVSGIANLLRDKTIPDMTKRHDEIGDLSGALRALTDALAQRIGDIENFAADVAHELKNPLTSLRSAIETVDRVSDQQARQKLMTIIRDDIDRMARLITDISSASRLDAELGRAKLQPFDIGAVLTQMETYYRQNEGQSGPMARVLIKTAGTDLRVVGIKGRLMQVFQNLLDNALSFSPPDKPVMLSVSRVGAHVQVVIEDSGPGIPENKLGAVFDRFYSERPKAEKFGIHSGLGLSIAKQIVEAHQGRIWAENCKDAAGNITGAKFVVQIPAMDE